MGNSLIQLSDGTTLIDLTEDTVTAARLLNPYTAHGKNGESITGTITNNGAAGTKTISSKTGSVAINKGYYSSAGTVSIVSTEQAKIIAGNIKSGISILGVTGTFTADATATTDDIVHGKTAYVDGDLVTGTYLRISAQVNSGSTGCSTTQLRIACSFEPSAIAVVSNSSNRTANAILAAWGMSNAYCTICNGTASSSRYTIARTEVTSNISNYWYYSGGYVYINRPNSTYSWAASNSGYRVFCFR